MGDAIDCPHCRLRVLPTNGICPSCAKDVHEDAAVARSRQEHAGADLIDELKQVRTGDSEVLERLAAVGFPMEFGLVMLAKRRTQIAAKRFEIMKVYLWPGYVALVGGLGVTMGTIVGTLHGMPMVVLCYGAIAYGLASVVAGHLRLRRCPLESPVQAAVPPASHACGSAQPGQQDQVA